MAKKARLRTPARGLARAAHEILRFLGAHDVPAYVIGGLAVLRWGEPRATQDVDLTLLAPLGEEAVPIEPDGVPIDVSLGALPFELDVLERASRWRLSPTIDLVVCSVEDLLVYKLVAGRPRDLLDIDGVVQLRWRDIDVWRVCGGARTSLANCSTAQISSDRSRTHFAGPCGRPAETMGMFGCGGLQSAESAPVFGIGNCWSDGHRVTGESRQVQEPPGFHFAVNGSPLRACSSGS